MHQRKSKKFLVYFFLLITISSINNPTLKNLDFQKVKDIQVLGLSETENKLILDQIENLNLKNIFFINKKEISNLIESNSLIETYKIFKNYPSNIRVIIKQTKYLAKINYENDIFIVGSNGKLIDNSFYKTKLPFIFGKPEVHEFLKFKKIIDQSKFPYDQIESFYFFPSKRWDIKLKNGVLLKLSNNSTKVSLDYAYNFLKNNNVGKFSIIDIRLRNQIIFNESKF
tara:strand:+ start:314 stop:994 length:681 start_codon:yes stop_codon:yes gene_type:complete